MVINTYEILAYYEILASSLMPWARGMAAYVRDGYGSFRQSKFECGCCEMLVVRVCEVRQNLYMYSLTVVGFYVLQWLCTVVGFYDHEPSWSCGL